jgi:hypothetical protein
MMDHMGEEDYVPNPVLEKALDVLFLLHADHELNASCTTVLQTASSLVDPYSAIAYVLPFLRVPIPTNLLLELAVRLYSQYPVIYRCSVTDAD